jgi:hypothetical protein
MTDPELITLLRELEGRIDARIDKLENRFEGKLESVEARLTAPIEEIAVRESNRVEDRIVSAFGSYNPAAAEGDRRNDHRDHRTHGHPGRAAAQD